MLLLKEIKKVVLSIPFLITAAALILMVSSQDVLFFSDKDKITAPKPGQEDYGYRLENDESLMMEEAVSSLYRCFLTNSYTTYPIGFYKNIILNDDKKEKMAEILSGLTGQPKQIFMEAAGDVSAPQNNIVPKEDLSFGDFKALMKRADRLLGGGSEYGENRLADFGKVPADYEYAKESYELTKTKDRFTGAHARLFSDYACIVMSVLPVFLSVSLLFKDKKKGLLEVLYTKKRHSFYIITAKYAAVVIAAFIPVLILAYTSCFSAAGLYPGEALDMMAPLKYSFLWILPSVLISAAVGLFLTVLTGSAAAVFVQALWWFIDINRGIFISGDYPFYLLVPRHNSLYQPEFFIEHFQSLLINRLFFTAAAIALVAATAVIYEMKRKGRIRGNASFTKKIFQKNVSGKTDGCPDFKN